jgi:hypothetical protein
MSDLYSTQVTWNVFDKNLQGIKVRVFFPIYLKYAGFAMSSSSVQLRVLV